MPGKAPSTLSSFKDALIVQSSYNSAPGLSGLCELAVRWRKTQVELWAWVDELGSECLVRLPASASPNDLVVAVSAGEFRISEIDLDDVSIIRDKPPLGRLLAMACAQESDDQIYAKLLVKFPWNFLVGMEDARLRVGGARVVKALVDIKEVLDRHELDADDLALMQAPGKPSLANFEAGLRRAIAEVLRKRRRADAVARRSQRDQKIRLAPFDAAIQKILSNYRRVEPPRRYPGGGQLPPIGYKQLERYLTRSALESGRIPGGIHTIPEGEDIFGKQGPAFEIDLDLLRMDLDRTLDSHWEDKRMVWVWKGPGSGQVSRPFDSKQAALTAWKLGAIDSHR